MMEGKNPLNMTQEVETKFTEMVLATIANNPLSVGKPLKYNLGSHVRIVGNAKQIAEVQKGSAGIYLVRLENGKFIVCQESNLEAIN